MRSIAADLPPELLGHIFSYMSNCRRDIATCRLVCRCFHASSSEHLIPRVLFANRLDVMERLWEVIEHPYFRQHVKELVYDASEYQELLATDLEEYEDTCDGHCTRLFCDVEAIKKTQRYAKFYRRLCRTRPWRGPTYESKKWHETGIHKGFHDYFRRWLAQNQMIEDGLGCDLITEALARLPKLRRVVFTDFRELAREGEGYAAVCRRAFGNTLEPLRLSFSEDIIREFMLLMDMIAESPQRNIQSLSIGGHPYDSVENFWATMKSNRRHVHRPFDPPAMPDEPDWDDEDMDSAKRVCAKLQQLRLPITFSRQECYERSIDIDAGIRESYTGRILGFSAPNLVQLSLCSLDLLFSHHTGGIGIRSTGERCLEFLLFPVLFSLLQHLELRG